MAAITMTETSDNPYLGKSHVFSKSYNSDKSKETFTWKCWPQEVPYSYTELLLPFKFGAVSLAQKTNSLIVPFGIKGSYSFRSKDLIIKIGKPFSIENMSLETANTLLYNKILSLIK